MSRACPVPMGFIDYLCAHEPMVAGLTSKQQYGIARIIMMAAEKRHRHKTHPECISVHCRDLEDMLGRRYQHIIAALGLLTPKGPWSIDDHKTRPYELAPQWVGHHYAYLADAIESRTVCVLVGANNRPARRKKDAILSKDVKGINAKTKAKMPWAVSVDLSALRGAIAYFKDPTAYDSPYKALLEETPERDRERCGFIHLQLLQVRLMAHNTLLPEGMLPQEYIEAESGRLYGHGVHLQNVCREVKIIALAGVGHEYDFANCHFSIFKQLAERAGCPCPTIEDYLAHKNETRQQLAQDIGATAAQVKECLLITLNGGTAYSLNSDIVKEIGAVKSLKLRQHPFYKALQQDIRRGTTAILNNARQDCRRVYNAMCKGISRRKKKGKLLAHILQGQEAQMLNIVLRHYGSEMLLLQHDGFTCRTEVDMDFLQAEILRETGLDMRLEEVSHDMTTESIVKVP